MGEGCPAQFRRHPPTAALRPIGIADFRFEGYPTVLRDLQGRQGHPVRATISDPGPLLLSCMLELNDTREGVLNIAFKIAVLSCLERTPPGETPWPT
ncbi:helicase HerA-like domain-containing protein [Endothiovibrio diazotrophicus]